MLDHNSTSTPHGVLSHTDDGDDGETEWVSENEDVQGTPRSVGTERSVVTTMTETTPRTGSTRIRNRKRSASNR